MKKHRDVSKARQGVRHRPAKTLSYPFFAICIDARGHEGSLFKGKIYRIIRPLPNDLPYDLRAIDEEQENDLYPADWFVPIDLPAKAKVALGSVHRPRRAEWN